MSESRLTPAAHRDLSAIWGYTEERWSPSQAELHLSDIQAAFTRLVEHPNRGRDIDEVRDGYRRYPTGSHLIFYTVTSSEAEGHLINVIRVLHQRMDPTLHV